MDTALAVNAGQPVSGTERDLSDFDAVARVHGRAIYGFALASLRDRDAAETITQDCLMKAFQARHGFRGESSVRTWLMRIAVNLVRDYSTSRRLRFWRRARRTELDFDLATQCIAARESSPEAAAAAKQRIGAVWNAAAKLSHQQRTVLLLRFVDDMDILEIAEATGLREGTVKTHLFRALQAVRERLEGMR